MKKYVVTPKIIKDNNLDQKFGLKSTQVFIKEGNNLKRMCYIRKPKGITQDEFEKFIDKIKF